MTNDEIERLCADLHDWHSADYVLDRTGAVPSDEYFLRTALKPAREAWIAAEFSKVMAAGEVRLVADDWPDIEIMIDGKPVAFECVEPQLPGRRRGDEYRRGEIIHKDADDWRKEAEAIPGMLQHAVQSKVAKGYPKSCNLLIYLSLSPYGILHGENVGAFAENTRAGRDHFRSIWVLYCDEAYNPWSAG